MSRPAFNYGLVAFCTLAIVLAFTVGGCGGGGGDGGGGTGGTTTGLVTVHVSDPPTCEAPAGPFTSVWVTITKVRAHLSSTADGSSPGWVDLIDLTDDPLQLDLLNLSSTSCLLATLGSTTGLPAGTYQQIRLHLLSNTPGAGVAVPSPNACAGTGGYNCIDHVVEGLELLLLSSQANTGLKIPPGQIAGGGIVLEAGQAADINIDFDACTSIHQLGNGSWRLKPTLHAGEVSLQNDVIAGRVVDMVTGNPINGGTAIVMVEQPDSGGVDRVIAQTLAAADGTFFFCPLSPGDYDIVVSAVDGAGTAYGTTVLFDVPVGSNVGDIPIIPVAGTTVGPATLTGLVTTTDPAAMPTSADVTVSALQSVTPSGGSPILVTVPTFLGSTPTVTTAAGGTCAAGTACATWTLVVPPANVSSATFASGGSTFSVPALPPFLYTVDAHAFLPDGTGTPNCTPSEIMTALDIAAMPLAAIPGMTTTAATIAFVMCTAGL